MVVSLRPGKFYGTSLPRPRFYLKPDGTDRVDPPLSVTDPLMSWAQEAHWSMGGLSFNRLRLQGKIEGNVERLRSQREKVSKAQAHSPVSLNRSDLARPKRAASPSPPPAPVASKKRRRLMELIEEDEEKEEEKEEEVPVLPRRRRLVKKLGDDFDRVAVATSENEGSNGGGGSDSTATKTRSRRLVKVGDALKKVAEEGEKSNPKGNKSKGDEGEKKSPVSGNGVRTSPRLAKRESI